MMNFGALIRLGSFIKKLNFNNHVIYTCDIVRTNQYKVHSKPFG